MTRINDVWLKYLRPRQSSTSCGCTETRSVHPPTILMSWKRISPTSRIIWWYPAGLDVL
jgi:hypothetical protein